MTPNTESGIVLETERLTLRRFTDSTEDAELLFELDSDPEVMRYIGPFGLPSVEAYRARIGTVWLAQYTHPVRGCMAVTEKSSGQFCGWIFMRPATEYRFATEAGWTRNTDMELGYRLRRAVWGRGYATEVAIPVVQLTLADPTVTCVVAAALVPNRASTRVMEKAGLSRVREFSIAGYEDPLVMYAACRMGCSPA
jgi:RimJ/RimL family protein N-acetyltransferase